MKKQYFIPQTEQTEFGDSIYLCQTTTSTNQEKAPGQQLAPKREEVQKVY